MSRLSKTETYAILWLNHTGVSVAEISTELNVSEKSVTSILEKHSETNRDKIKTGSEPTKKKQSKTLMVNETAVKKNKSVSIMTEAASQQSDQVLKNMRSRLSDKGIFRPNG